MQKNCEKNKTKELVESKKPNPKQGKNGKRRERVRLRKEENKLPTYEWNDTESGKNVQIQSTIANMDIPPDKDAAIEQGMTAEEYAEAKWERVISKAPEFTGPKQKGYW